MSTYGEAQRRYAQSERGRQKMREFAATERGREIRRRANRKYKATHPEYTRERKRIHMRVATAVRRGDIVKVPCHCGSEVVEAHHHNGYAPEYELDVVWLCPLHHKHAHGRGGQ